MSVEAGKLRHKVVIEQPVRTQDPISGAMVTTWQVVGAPWASVEPLSARELLSANAEHSEVRARITMRMRPLSADMRLIHRGKVYNIAGVIPDKESGLEYVTVPVSEGLNIR